MRGFYFKGHRDDLAEILPLTSRIGEAIGMYEIVQSEIHTFSPLVLDVINNLTSYQQKLGEVMGEVSQHPTEKQAHFCCIPDTRVDDSFVPDTEDSETWLESCPATAGLYHAFVYNKLMKRREHRCFIVIRGHVPGAGDELYNQWHDVKQHLTCAQFLACEEFHWLRSVSIRNLNRLACILAQALGVKIRHIRDFAAAGCQPLAAVPDAISFVNDLRLNQNSVEMVNHACFTDVSYNGTLFDTEGSDGFRIFCGRPDGSEEHCYGTTLRATCINAFPTASLMTRDGQPVPICDRFMRTTQQLGYDTNDEIVQLMELLVVQDAKTSSSEAYEPAGDCP